MALTPLLNVKQAGAELGQAQVKLEVIVEVGVEDRCIYLIPSEFKTFPAGGSVAESMWWVGCGVYVVGWLRSLCGGWVGVVTMYYILHSTHIGMFQTGRIQIMLGHEW